MKFTGIFFVYSAILGALVGGVAALFLLLVEWCIHVIWETGPHYISSPFYPLIIGIIGGLIIGLLQKYMGNYPKTIHETLHEYQETNRIDYKNALFPNFLMGLIVLAFGASLGPEGALASIVGGLITWVGERLKLTLQQKEQLTQLGIGAMLSAIFYAPFIGVGEAFEEKKATYPRWQKIILYTLATLFGLLAFKGINQLFEKESIFAITTPAVNWTWQGILLIIPAVALGYLVGVFFLKTEFYIEKVTATIHNKVLLGIIGGVFIGVFGMLSSYFLFSGEHELQQFSAEAVSMSIVTVLAVGFGKILLTNICFACGWRGGKIFPAIFASVAIGFALANLFPYTPGLLIAVVVATCCTVVLGQPIVTTALLVLLFPLQFAPFILIVSLVVQRIRKNHVQSDHTTTA